MNKAMLDRIVSRINEGNCLVILGPRLLSSDGTSINTLLNDRLVENLGKRVNNYSGDEFLSFNDKTRDNYIEDEVKKFFDELEPNDLYQKIAEIPFSMVINTAPDQTLKKALEEKGLGFVYGYYHKGQENKAPVKTETRYVYNIFGDYTELDSMILTYKDLYEYLQSIMGDIGQEIKKMLQDAKAVLFFGFSFDKWYFQLLLWLMEVEGKLLNSHDITEDNIKNIYAEEFDLEFFEENTAAEIISELHQAKLNGDINEPEGKEYYAEMYISYAWGGESEEMAIEMEKTLQINKIRLIRDKNDLGYKERIKEFMERIGKSEGVVVVVSDKYLKSRYCMYELNELYNNEDFNDRIFPIVLGDAKIFSREERMEYEKYWKTKMLEINKKIEEGGAEIAKALGDEYVSCERIFDNFEKQVGVMADMNVLNTDQHLSTNFEAMLNEIKKKLNILQ
ncbi:MAG: toll/interleukin-1 receptor domain-containing protein [Flavobacteriaceae bacterium]